MHSDKDHDEAVLLVAESHVDYDEDQFGDKVKSLQVIARKYLKEPLLQSIIWPEVSKMYSFYQFLSGSRFRHYL